MLRECKSFGKRSAGGDRDVAQTIVHEFWAAFGPWIFGAYPAGDQPRGVLGSILLYEVGHQRAAELWVPTVTRFEEGVFSTEGFSRCADAFDPAKGGFARFFKRWLTWKALQVVAEISTYQGHSPKPPEGTDVDEILEERDPQEDNPFGGFPPGRGTLPECFREMLRGWLELYAQEGRGKAETTAAWELKYRAYWPIEEMPQATQALLAEKLSPQELSNLSKEYDKSQEEVRQLYPELNTAFANFQTAQETLHRIRQELLHGEVAPEELLDQWEEEASERTKEELQRSFQNLPPAERSGREGRKWQYQIAWKTWSQARGKLNRWRVKVQGYEACRIPWIRSQEEVGRLWGISQPTVFRHQKSVQEFLRNKWEELHIPTAAE